MTLSHREYLCDIVSGPAGSFSVQNFCNQSRKYCNLSLVIRSFLLFQQYRLDGMIFQFKSMSADALNSTNTALGQVIMATTIMTLINRCLIRNMKWKILNFPLVSNRPLVRCILLNVQELKVPLNELYVAAGGNIPPGGTASMYILRQFPNCYEWLPGSKCQYW